MRLIIAGHETDIKHRAVRLLSLSLIIISFFAVTLSVAYGDENASNTASDETASLQPQDAAILLVQERASEPSAPAPAKQRDEYGDVTKEEVEPAGEKAAAPAPAKPSDEYGDVTQEEAERTGEKAAAEIADPIEPFNRAMYHFNDKMYFWVLKPVTRGYKVVVPEDFRGLFSNFYNNLKAPIRIVNNLLQGEPGYAGKELVRLVINSTIGVGGLRDCAGECFGIKGREADFGQTLGIYGVGYGFYIVWPVLGPSSPRDTVGFVGDWLLRPQTYLSSNFFDPLTIGLYVHETVNKTSFHLGDYEALKAAAIDPYIAIRDAYVQNRNEALKR